MLLFFSRILLFQNSSIYLLAALLYKAIRYLFAHFLPLFYSLQLYIMSIKNISIIRKIKLKPKSLRVVVIKYIITRGIAYNMIYVIIIFSLSIVYIVEKTFFRIVNFDIIEKTLSSHGRFYNFQGIKERRFLIREIIDKIAIFENRFNYQALAIISASPVRVYIYRRHGYHYINDSSSDFEEGDDPRVSFMY